MIQVDELNTAERSDWDGSLQIQPKSTITFYKWVQRVLWAWILQNYGICFDRVAFKYLSVEIRRITYLLLFLDELKLLLAASLAVSTRQQTRLQHQKSASSGPYGLPVSAPFQSFERLLLVSTRARNPKTASKSQLIAARLLSCDSVSNLCAFCICFLLVWRSIDSLALRISLRIRLFLINISHPQRNIIANRILCADWADPDHNTLFQSI